MENTEESKTFFFFFFQGVRGKREWDATSWVVFIPEKKQKKGYAVFHIHTFLLCGYHSDNARDESDTSPYYYYNSL